MEISLLLYQHKCSLVPSNTQYRIHPSWRHRRRNLLEIMCGRQPLVLSASYSDTTVGRTHVQQPCDTHDPGRVAGAMRLDLLSAWDDA